MLTQMQPSSHAMQPTSTVSLNRGIVLGLIGGLVGTIVMDLVLIATLSAFGLPPLLLSHSNRH